MKLTPLADRVILTMVEPEETTKGEASVFYLVFWTEGGSVYHKALDCYHLKDAKSIQSGSIQAAIDSGKEKACSVCGDE